MDAEIRKFPTRGSLARLGIKLTFDVRETTASRDNGGAFEVPPYSSQYDSVV